MGTSIEADEEEQLFPNRDNSTSGGRASEWKFLGPIIQGQPSLVLLPIEQPLLLQIPK